MPGPLVHRIDPVIGSVGGVGLWWYGRSCALGCVELLAYSARPRRGQASGGLVCRA